MNEEWRTSYRELEVALSDLEREVYGDRRKEKDPGIAGRLQVIEDAVVSIRLWLMVLTIGAILGAISFFIALVFIVSRLPVSG